MSTRASSGQQTVGVDLQASEDTRAVIEAIKQDNPDVAVSEIPGIVRLQDPRELVIRRDTVGRLLGREWETHEFQLALVSYHGHIADWDDDKIVIKWEHGS